MHVADHGEEKGRNLRATAAIAGGGSQIAFRYRLEVVTIIVAFRKPVQVPVGVSKRVFALIMILNSTTGYRSKIHRRRHQNNLQYLIF